MIFQAAMFLAVSIFLFRWQIIEHERFQAQASSRLVKQEVSALRGDILARDGSVLSYSEPRFDIYVYMDNKHGLLAAENANRQTRPEFTRKVSELLEIDEEGLINLLGQDQKWIKIADKVTKEDRDKLLSIPTDIDPELYLDGLDYLDTAIRNYPEGDLAAHVLGFVGKDEFGHDVGVSGLEQYFNGLLKPQVGISTLETDSNQNIIAISNNRLREARRGATITITIDKNIQEKVETLLEQGVERYMAKSGTVIVVDPRTGEIIAMANYPDFDPGNYEKETDTRVFRNHAITSPYEIGSVGKVYTMSAAVDQDKVQPQTVVIQGHSGCQEIIEKRVICTYDKKPQGALTATEALIQSDNLALFATAELIGEQEFANYLEDFGLGRRTKIQLAGEDAGFIKSGDKWNEADLAAYSYGHSYFQTTLQAIMGAGVLANEGKLMEPMIVKEISDSADKKRVYEPRVVTQVIKPESAETMSNMLYEVFKSNLYEAKYKDLAKYKIAMKSGTALIPYTALDPPQSKAGYSNEVNSTYVGYDASSLNTFIMLVNLSEPQTVPKLSYNNARILWLDLFNEIKNDLGVPTVYEHI
jgi:cell division protein FtsI/penicillin-binding protein 2